MFHFGFGMERNTDNFLVRLDFTSDPPKTASHLHSPSMWVLVPKQRPPAKRPSPLGEAHFAKGFYQRTAGPSKLTNWDVVLGWFVWTDASYQLCHENGIYGMFQIMACLIKKNMVSYYLQCAFIWYLIWKVSRRIPASSVLRLELHSSLAALRGWIRLLLMVDFQSLMTGTYANSEAQHGHPYKECLKETTWCSLKCQFQGGWICQSFWPVTLPRGGCASPHFAGPHSPFPRLMIRKAAKRSKAPKMIPMTVMDQTKQHLQKEKPANSYDSSVFSLMVSTPLQNYVS